MDPQEALPDATEIAREDTLYKSNTDALTNVRTKFVLESVSLLAELENCLLALVKDRGKVLNKKSDRLLQFNSDADVP